MRLDEIARVVGGELHGDAGLVVDGAAFVDSRTPVERGLYVAVVGERVDGHDFATGVHAVLGGRPTDAPTVVVADPVVALGRLARHVLDRLDADVVALTGSQGKTGTKDLLAHVLGSVGPTVATAANNNNEIGVPLTVLRADADTEHLVVEMGARGVGHIAYLCEIAPPQTGVVLNVGTAHIGEFGGVEAIAAAKGEIVESLSQRGVAVLNADDPRVSAMASRTQAWVLTFGLAGDISWRDVRLDDLGRASFELGYDNEWCEVSLLQTGEHQVANAAAAAAVGLGRGLRLPVIAAALSTARSASPWRMELHDRSDGLRVLNDAYNANPASMTAALHALASLGRSRAGRTIAVLGEMKELGAEHDAGHREVGAQAAEAGIDVVVVVGDAARGIADGASGSHVDVVRAAGREAALEWVRKNADAADVVLVKASRAAALEWVADRLLDETDPDQEGERTSR